MVFLSITKLLRIGSEHMKLTIQELEHIVRKIDEGFTVQFNYTTLKEYKKYCYEIDSIRRAG